MKAEELHSSVRQLLDWLSNAERSIRYQSLAMPDSEEQLENQLVQLEVFAVYICHSLGHFMKPDFNPSG